MDATYRWDPDSGIFRLDDAGNPENARFARTRLPSPRLLSIVAAEGNRRRSPLVQLEALVRIGERALPDSRKRLADARDRLLNAHGFRWQEPGDQGAVHTFEITISHPDALPFPHADDVESVRIKRLVNCSSAHCDLKGRSFEVNQPELDAAIAAFERLRVNVEVLRSGVTALENSLERNRAALDAARRLSSSPIRILAWALERAGVGATAPLIPARIGPAGAFS